MFSASLQLALLAMLIGVIVLFGRRLSARLRYTLWGLILLKAVLPPFFSTPLAIAPHVYPWTASAQPASVSGITESPVVDTEYAASYANEWDESEGQFATFPADPILAGAQHASSVETSARGPVAFGIGTIELLFGLWFAGMLLYFGAVLYYYGWAMGLLAKSQPLEKGPIFNLLQRLGRQLKLRRIPRIVLCESVRSPFLWGLWNGTIALPADFPGEVSPEEMESVLLHELMHWKRCDMLIARWELIVRGLFWFHPLVLFSLERLRRERESACDEAVLESGYIPARQYGDSLVAVLLTTREQAMVPVGFLGFLGILERTPLLQQRLEEIMSQHQHVKHMGMIGWAVILGLVLCVLPMSAAQKEATKDTTAPAAESATEKTAEPQTKDEEPQPKADSVPKIIKMFPENHAKDADPNISQVYLTFDRPMGGGMAWAQQNNETALDSDGKTFWTEDRRTCVMPVHLKADKTYVALLNCKPFIGFRSEDGVASEYVFYTFTTGTGPVDEKKREELAKDLFVRLDWFNPSEPPKLQTVERNGKLYFKEGTEEILAEPLSKASVPEKDDSKYGDVAPGLLKRMRLGGQFNYCMLEELRKSFSEPAPQVSAGGLLVDRVIRGSQFDKLNVRPGDMIVGIDRWRMNTSTSVNYFTLQKYPQDTTIKVFLFRGNMLYYIDIPIPGNPGPADGGYESPTGMTYLVYYGAKGDFVAKTQSQLLQRAVDALENKDVYTDFSRVRIENSKLVGVLATDDPDGFTKAIDASSDLKFLRSERLTKQSYENLFAKGINQWLPPEDGGYQWNGLQYIVTLKPKGDFHPKSEKELMNEMSKVFTSCYVGMMRTEEKDGTYYGSYMTDDADVLKQCLDKSSTLEFVKAERLTKELFEKNQK